MKETQSSVKVFYCSSDIDSTDPSSNGHLVNFTQADKARELPLKWQHGLEKWNTAWILH